MSLNDTLPPSAPQKSSKNQIFQTNTIIVNRLKRRSMIQPIIFPQQCSSRAGMTRRVQQVYQVAHGLSFDRSHAPAWNAAAHTAPAVRMGHWSGQGPGYHARPWAPSAGLPAPPLGATGYARPWAPSAGLPACIEVIHGWMTTPLVQAIAS